MDLSRRRRRKSGGAFMQLLKIRKPVQFLAMEQFPAKRRKSGGAPVKQFPAPILDLPFDLAANIFSRLPIKEIFCCKSVCKLWKTYLSDPESFKAVQPADHHYVGVILCTVTGCLVAQLKPKEATATLIDWLIQPRLNDQLVGSCNGLVCLLHQNPTTRRHDQLSVSNPMTRESRLLPRLTQTYDYDVFLFGFSSKTGEYKVLRIYKQDYDDDSAPGAQICTVNGAGWRDIVDQRVPLPRHFGHCRGITFKGALLWVTGDQFSGGERLVSFDIAEEKIEYIPLPPGTAQGGIGLGVLRNRLCIFHGDNRIYRWNIWSMEESWTNLRIPLGWLRFRRYHPFVHLNDNEMVTIRGQTLVSRNRKENRTTELLHLPRDFQYADLVPYEPSFLPLDYLLQGKTS